MSRVETLVHTPRVDITRLLPRFNVFNEVRFGANTLSDFGITTQEYRRLKELTHEEREKELHRQKAAFVNEVLMDRPTSILYRYWFGPEGLYTDSSLQEKYSTSRKSNRFFDERERAGIPLAGFNLVTKLLWENPHKIVLWYSPPGPASFDHDYSNPFSAITYNYGQLYVQYYDGAEVKAVALKISNEKVLNLLAPEISGILSSSKGNQRIADSLLHPAVIDQNIDGFLNTAYQNDVVYKDKAEKKHLLLDVLQQAKRAFLNQEDLTFLSEREDNVLFQSGEMTEDTILELYLSTIQGYMKAIGQNRMNLSGSCGGKAVSLNDVDSLLSKDFYSFAGLHSSLQRVITQGEEEWHEGRCRVCGKEPIQVGPCSICGDCVDRLESVSAHV